ATRKAIDAGRSRVRRPLSVGDPASVADPSEAEAATGGDPADPLWVAVRTLPIRQRAAVVHRFVLDRSYRDIAEDMGSSEEADRGLLDVGYGFAESPFGRLLVAVTDRGLVTLAYPNEEVGLTLERLATRVSPRIIESARATERIRRELDEYFEGRRKDFDVGV